MSKALAISLVIVAFILGIGVGYTLTPAYGEMSGRSGMQKNSVTDKELMFINDMLAYNRGSIIMAEQVIDLSSRADMKEIATNLIRTKSEEISRLNNWKASWFNDTSKTSEIMHTDLGGYDDEFDLRFLEELERHHEDTNWMAQDIAKNTKRHELLGYAEELITKQKAELKQIKELQQQLQR